MAVSTAGEAAGVDNPGMFLQDDMAPAMASSRHA